MNTINLQTVKALNNLDFLAKQLVEGFITGLHKSPYHGFSVEFAEHRLYNTGESTRHIDWKVFAKTDRLYVKQFEEETNLRCYLVIDNSSSMYYPTKNKGKIKFSILAGAAIAYFLHKQRDAVGLFTFSDKIDTQTQVKSSGIHLNKLFSILENLLKPDKSPKKTDIPPILHEIAEKVHKRSLIIIFSDFFQSYDSRLQLINSLQHLKHNKHEVILFHVLDKKTEVEFDFSDRPYKFLNLEDNTSIKLSPEVVKEEYVNTVKEFLYDLKIRCSQLKIDYVETDISEGFKKVLTTYLVKRSKMK
ncbi:MAG TPA: DUF58 domain-containing protein [Cyclobacteriaceae bacterium]